MRNYKSAKKAYKQSIKRTLRNRIVKTKIKTCVRKVESQVLCQDFSGAKSALSIADSLIMKAVAKKVLKLNTASRKLSKLANKVKSLETLV